MTTPPAPTARARRVRLGARRALAVALGRLGGWASRTLGRGAGENIGGKIILQLAPDTGTHVARALSLGSVVVSGTNGKTTTASLIRAIAAVEGLRVAGNQSGSNMPNGIVGALLDGRGADLGVFEVDEFALPKVVAMVRPRVVVLTNIFRDQLDRFGEPERVRSLFEESIAGLPEGATVIVNADDPMIAELGGEPVRYAVEIDAADAAHAAGEPEVCPVCGALLVAEMRRLVSLGAFRCNECGWKTPDASVVVRVVAREGLEALTGETGGARFRLNLGGIYNAYNAAAAVAAADALGIARASTLRALESFRPRFGRLEQLDVGGRAVLMALAKNPAGTDAILGELRREDVGAVAVALNDLAADGKDVSWIWDVDFERLAGLGRPVWATGRRAEEMALRLRYAGIDARYERDATRAVRAVAAAAEDGLPAVALVTYTAMLQVRAELLGGRKAAVADVPS